MAKVLKLDQLETNVEKLDELFVTRELQLGDAVDAKVTTSHKEVEAIAKKLEALASKIRKAESDKASAEVDELGASLANVVGDKEKLAQLLALASSGKLTGLLDEESHSQL